MDAAIRTIRMPAVMGLALETEQRIWVCSVEVLSILPWSRPFSIRNMPPGAPALGRFEIGAASTKRRRTAALQDASRSDFDCLTAGNVVLPSPALVGGGKSRHFGFTIY